MFTRRTKPRGKRVVIGLVGDRPGIICGRPGSKIYKGIFGGGNS
jgi:hypothetical protein